MTPTADYEFWNDFLFRESAVCTPAEFHGVLCATQSAHSSNWIETVLSVMDIPGEEVSTELRTAVEAFYDIVGTALKDDQYRLQLLLPDDALPIASRVSALGDWCHGYLHGIGSLGEATIRRLDEQAQEALRDMTQMTQLDGAVEDSDTAEADLAELIEYIRIVVLTVYSQLNPGVEPGANTTH